MSVSIKYKGNTIASASTETTKTIKTAGKYCEADILVENTPDGGDAPVINPLSVTANGTYTAPSGVDGYSPITVNVPQGITPSGKKLITDTSETDVAAFATAQVSSDTLLAENIKKNVNILGVVGSFEGGGGGIDVKSAAKCEIVTVGANTVTNPVAAMGYFGYATPFPDLTIIALDAFTVNNAFGYFTSKSGASIPMGWWRWRSNATNWPSSFNTSWDTLLVEGTKYLVIEW